MIDQAMISMIHERMNTIGSNAEYGHEKSCTTNVDETRREGRDIVTERIRASCDLVAHSRNSHSKTSEELY